MTTVHDAQTMMDRRRRGLGRNAAAPALLALGALLLSSCGAGVSTELTLEDESSGTRTMHATIASEELEDEEITVDGIEGVIADHIPDGLEYEGSELSERDDGEYVQTTFSLPFESVEGYEENADALLQAGGVDVDAEVTFDVPDSALVSGLTLEENFTSSELLAWLPEALVAEGLVDESDQSSVLDSDEGSEVTFDGETYEVSSSRISVEDVQDDGFTQLGVEAVMHEDGGYTGTIRFFADEVMSNVRKERVDSYFDEATPEGAELSRGVPESSGFPDGMTLSFEASDLEALNAALQTATGSEDTGLSVEEAAADQDPTRFLLDVSGQVDGSASASPDARTPSFRVVLPQEWELPEEQASSGASITVDDAGVPTVEAQGETFSATLERSVPLQDVQVETALGFLGGITQTYTFTASGEAVDQVGDAFETLLAPPESVGSLESSQDDGGDTVYTVTVDGEDAEDLTEQLQEWLPGATVAVDRSGDFTLTPSYTVDVFLPLSETLLPSGVTGSYEQVLDLPATHSYQEEEFPAGGADISDGTLTVGGDVGASAEMRESYTATGAGFTLTSLVVLASILLVVAVLVVLLVVFRRRVTSLVGGVAARGRHAASASGAAAAAGPAGGPADDPAQDSAEPLSEAEWRRRFTEADLH